MEPVHGNSISSTLLLNSGFMLEVRLILQHLHDTASMESIVYDNIFIIIV